MPESAGSFFAKAFLTQQKRRHSIASIYGNNVHSPPVKERGATLLSVLIGSTITALGIYCFITNASLSVKSAAKMHDSVVAEAYVSELLEFFRSFKARQLREYLKKNPLTLSTSVTDLYKLCSHVNILDRDTNKLLNDDPLANLGPSTFASSLRLPNRFYQIQIVDMKTLALNSDLCDKTAAQIYFYGESIPVSLPSKYQLKQSETFLITVGLSYFERTRSNPDVQRVVLSAVLPPEQ